MLKFIPILQKIPKRNVIQYILFPCIVVVIGIITHWIWFTPAILTNGDWGYKFDIERKEYLSLPYLWSSSQMGLIDVVNPTRHPVLVSQGLLSYLFDGQIIEKIVFFYPFLFGGLGMYFLLLYLLRSPMGALVGSFVFSYNTYFLIGDNLLLYNAFALAPTILLLFIVGLAKKHVVYLILAGLVGYVMSVYEFRGFYILAWILGFYTLFYAFFIQKKMSVRELFFIGMYAAIPIAIVLALNLNWILGITNIDALADNQVFSRGLFGNEFMNILRATTLFHPFWTGAEAIAFIIQPIPFHFFFIPLVAFIGLFTNKKNRYIIFWACITILGIFLTKQVGAPLGWVYEWLYGNLPGFNAFREASKFYFVVALGYSVLIGAFVKTVLSEKIIFAPGFATKASKTFLVFCVALLFLWNTKPMITGEMKGLYTPKDIPHDYLVWNAAIDSRENDFFRISWVPSVPRWVTLTQMHPSLQQVDLLHDTTYAPFNDYKKGFRKLSTQEQILYIFQSNYSDTIFDSMGLKYFVVPIQDLKNDDDFFAHYGGHTDRNIRQWFINQLDKLDYLERVDPQGSDLVTFINKNTKPYVSSFTTLVGVQQLTDLNEKYNFVTNHLHKPFNFVNQQSYASTTAPLVNTYTPFEILDGVTIDGHTIRDAHPSNSYPMLYTNTSIQPFFYEIRDGLITFFTQNEQPLRSPHTQPTGERIIIARTEYVPSKEYLLEVDGQIHSVDQTTESVRLGYVSSGIDVYTVSGTNTIANPSFEQTLWEDRVHDCNDYDDNPILDMKHAAVASDGARSLELQATRHAACTNILVDVRAASSTNYLLSFEYQSPTQSSAAYNLGFVHDHSMSRKSWKRPQRETIPVTSLEWHTFSRVISNLHNVEKVSLSVYAHATDDITNNIIRYDNFVLQELTLQTSITPPLLDNDALQRTPVALDQLAYIDENHHFVNHIPNHSFEKSLWHEAVHVCNAYGNTERMNMTQSSESTHGDFSIELATAQHTACTQTGDVPITPGSYLLRIDYQSVNGADGGYSLRTNSPKGFHVSEHIQTRDTDWHTFSQIIDIPHDVSIASFDLNAHPIERKSGMQKIRYDNVQLIKLPPLQHRYYLVDDPGTKFVEPKSIDFTLVNPTKKLVSVKGATTPFYLAMSESYHDQWQLQFDNDKIHGFFEGWIPWVSPDRVSDDHHFALNGFLNGWYVDIEKHCATNALCTANADGSYDIQFVIEFFPQRWFYLGLLISGSTFVGIIGYLVYSFVSRQKRRTSPPIPKKTQSIQ